MRINKSGIDGRLRTQCDTNGFLNRRSERSNRPGVTGSNNQKNPSNRAELLTAAAAVGASDIEARRFLRDLLAIGRASRNGSLADKAALGLAAELTAAIGGAR